MQTSNRDDFSEDGYARENQMDYDQVLAKIGFGKTQWIMLLVSGLLTITSMATQYSLGIIVIASQCEFKMSQSEKGIFIASCISGFFLSTYFWGYISDALGRRCVLLYSIFMSTILQFITIFVVNIWLFNVINLFIGISLGGISASIYAYLSEYNTAKYRAVVINYSTTFVSVASIYVPVIAWWVLSYKWSVTVVVGYSFRPWRLIIISNLVPGLIGGLILLAFPESPRFLLAKNKQEEALEAVDFICKCNTGMTVNQLLKVDNFKLQPETLDEEDLLISKRGCGIFINIWKATVPLFQKPHGFNFTLSALVIFGLFFSCAGLQIWYPEIVNRSSDEGVANSLTVCEILDRSFNSLVKNSSMTANEICDDSISTKTYIDNIILGFGTLIAFSAQGVLLNPLGRKNVIMGTLIISIICGLLLHVVRNNIAVLIFFCLYIILPNLSISVMCGAVVDLVPVHLRGKAVAISFTLGRLGIVFAANLIGVMLEPFCNSTFGIFTATLLVCVILVSKLPI